MDKKSDPPISVTILAVLVLFITVWNGVRIYSAIANWQVLKEFGANPLYILISGFFWMIASLWLYRALWKGHQYAIRAGLALAGFYTVWYWCDRLFFQPAPAPNALFSAIVSAVFLAFFIITLSLPASKSFFNKE